MKNLFLFIFILCFLNSSCVNLYEEMASKDTDAAILYSARMALAEGDWDTALSEFARLSATALAETDVIVDRASAYSGRCGLDFLALADMIDNIGSTNLMDLLSDNFIAVDASNSADCKLAEDLLKTVADANGVVSTERGQFLMAFSSLAKIGTILNNYSDTDDDGAVDAGWDPCDGNGATDLPANDVSEIGTAIVLFYKNLEGTSFGSAITAPIVSACTLIDGSPFDFCDEIDTTGMTDQHRQAIRGMIRETDDGIGLAVSAGDAAANACEP
jgi:hypothetical protein